MAFLIDLYNASVDLFFKNGFRSKESSWPKQLYKIPLLVILILLHVSQKWLLIGLINPTIDFNVLVSK